jgi:heptosyltransferase-2
VSDAIGKLTLRETFALLRHCDLHIGNDSGPMHLAAAAGRAVVEISPHPVGGAADADVAPERFAPWRTDHLILRPALATPPCTHECQADQPHCILSVGVEEVLDAALTLTGGAAAAGRPGHAQPCADKFEHPA